MLHDCYNILGETELFHISCFFFFVLFLEGKIIPGIGVPENWHSNLADSPSTTLLFTISTTKEGADLAAEINIFIQKKLH